MRFTRRLQRHSIASCRFQVSQQAGQGSPFRPGFGFGFWRDDSLYREKFERCLNPANRDSKLMYLLPCWHRKAIGKQRDKCDKRARRLSLPHLSRAFTFNHLLEKDEAKLKLHSGAVASTKVDTIERRAAHKQSSK